MLEQNKAVVRAWFAESDRRKALPLDLCAPGFTAHYPGNPVLELDSFQPHLATFYAAFPDLTQTVVNMVAEGNQVAFRVVSRGTHSGDFRGIPPTGERISVVQIGIARLVDGKIAEIWCNPDRMGMMQQLGLIPPPQPTQTEQVAT
jgi:predicted ester cyclase